MGCRPPRVDRQGLPACDPLGRQQGRAGPAGRRLSRVLACGLATVDVVQTVERLPAADEKVTALDTVVEAGGPALNAAVTAALLGVPSRLVTAVGRRGLAEVVRADCAAHAVDLVDRAADGFAVPVSTVLVTQGSGERAVVSRNATGSSSLVVVPDVAELDVLLEGVLAVLLDGHHLALALALAPAARQRGIPVVLDGGSWKDGLEKLLRHVDVLVASADFRSPAGDSLPELLELGPTWVARSAGPAAVRWRSAEGAAGRVLVPQVDEVVDTLGAGDVLHGALVADLVRHGRGDLPASLTRAVGVASRSVTAPGARGWARPGPTRCR